MADSLADGPNWNQLESELRAYKNRQQQAWGGIDDLAIARYVSNESSADESDRVEKAMASLPAVREAVELLQHVIETHDLIAGSPSELTDGDEPMQTLQQAMQYADKLAHERTAFNKLLELDDRLVMPLREALELPTARRASAISKAVSFNDALYLVAAGEGDREGPISTSPFWFTHLLEPPERLWWDSENKESRWHLRIWNSNAGEIHSCNIELPEAQLSDDVRRALPKNEDIRWEVRVAKNAPSGETLVRGVFILLDETDSLTARTRMDELAALNDGLDRELALAGCLFEIGLYDRLLAHLQRLHDNYSAGAPGFLVLRALASVYAAIQSELTGARYMGNPEGLWAMDRSNFYLDRSYQRLGINSVITPDV